MPKRNEHLVVIMLEPMEVGKEFEIWPLHLTIVPWFPCDDWQRLDKTLTGIAKKHQRFTMTTDRKETWGKKDQFEVMRIEDTPELHALHWTIFHGLEKNGFPVHQKDFLGAKYRPHLALRNHKQREYTHLKRGEVFAVNSFSLFKQVRLKKSGRMIKSLRKEYVLG